jgi:hypothetical protein
MGRMQGPNVRHPNTVNELYNTSVHQPWGLNSRPLVEDRYHSQTPFT